MKRNILFISTLAISVFSCDTPDTDPVQPYDNGVIVLNAGNFTDNNGTLSLLQRTGQAVSYDIFQKENLRSLSGSLSGYAEVSDKGIILVDNSTAGKDAIELVNARTFKSEATIPSADIENPRNVAKVSDTKAYVTCWDATGDFSNFYKNPGYVAVIDLSTNKLVKKIVIQNGAESLVVVGNEAFVGSAMGSGQTHLTVIDIATDAIKQKIDVGIDPEVIGMDANNKLWLYAGYELKRMNITTKTIESTVPIVSPNPAKSPSTFTLSADKKTLFFTHSYYTADWTQLGEVYSASVDAQTISTTKPFVNKLVAGLAIDPQTGNVYAGLVPSYKQAGYVFRYQPNGTLIDSVKAEIAPTKFFFKK